jgi:hypothetical protein
MYFRKIYKLKDFVNSSEDELDISSQRKKMGEKPKVYVLVYLLPQYDFHMSVGLQESANIRLLHQMEMKQMTKKMH